jgi:CubicO group peptidase (beta-lactamase class C family)
MLKRIGSLSVFSTLVMIGLAGCGKAPEVAPATTATEFQVPKAVEDEITASLDHLKLPGVAIALVRGDKVVYAKGFGLRDVDKKLPMTAETLFPIGAITKTFTATGVGLLVDDGKVGFDSTVREIIPDFQTHNRAVTERATLRDVLAEQTGLPHHQLMFSLYPHSKDEVFKRLKFLPTTGDFRKVFHASDLNYLVAGLALEHQSRTPFDEFVQHKLLDAIGLKHTHIAAGSPTPNDELITPYIKGLAPAPLPSPAQSAEAARGMLSNASDLGTWLAFHIGRGNWGGKQLVSAKTMQRLHLKQVRAGEHSAYSMGWVIDSLRHLRHSYQIGRVDGTKIHMAYLSAKNLGVVVMTNDQLEWYPRVVSAYLFDLMLGAPGTPLTERVQQHEAEELAAAEKAKAEQEKKVAEEKAQSERKMMAESASPRSMRLMAAAAPMAPNYDAFTGTYHHGAYGEVQLAVKEGRLKINWADMVKEVPVMLVGRSEIQLAPNENETLPPVPATLVIQRDSNGAPSGLAWKLEPAVDPIQFKKR